MKPFHFSGDYGQTLDRLVTTEKMSATYMEVVLSGDIHLNKVTKLQVVDLLI